MIQPTIGQQIRILRMERGWTLAELAKRAGTSAPTLHRYENGWERFEVATLRRLALALGSTLNISLEPIRTEEQHASPTRRKLVRILTPLFWDHLLQESDLDEYPEWVLRRVLMFGNTRQVSASRAFFGDDAVRAAATHREIDERTQNYWQLILAEESDDSQSTQL